MYFFAWLLCLNKKVQFACSQAKLELPFKLNVFDTAGPCKVSRAVSLFAVHGFRQSYHAGLAMFCCKATPSRLNAKINLFVSTKM